MNEELKMRALGVLADLMDGLAGTAVKDVLPKERLELQLDLITGAQSAMDVLFDDMLMGGSAG